MDALCRRCLDTKCICLIFEQVQYRTLDRNSNARSGFQCLYSTKMSYGYDLPGSMCMLFVRRRVRMHNHYPVHNMDVSKCRNAYLIGNKQRKQYERYKYVPSSFQLIISFLRQTIIDNLSLQLERSILLE